MSPSPQDLVGRGAGMGPDLRQPQPTTMPLAPLSEAPKHLLEISRAILNPTRHL